MLPTLSRHEMRVKTLEIVISARDSRVGYYYVTIIFEAMRSKRFSRRRSERVGQRVNEAAIVLQTVAL